MQPDYSEVPPELRHLIEKRERPDRRTLEDRRAERPRDEAIPTPDAPAEPADDGRTNGPPPIPPPPEGRVSQRRKRQRRG